jgi:hypothetical protein
MKRNGEEGECGGGSGLRGVATIKNLFLDPCDVRNGSAAKTGFDSSEVL